MGRVWYSHRTDKCRVWEHLLDLCDDRTCRIPAATLLGHTMAHLSGRRTPLNVNDSFTVASDIPGHFNNTANAAPTSMRHLTLTPASSSGTGRMKLT